MLEQVPRRREAERQRLVGAPEDPIGSHGRRPEIEEKLDVLAGERQPPPLQSVEHLHRKRVRRLEGDVARFLAAIAFAKIHDLTIEPARLEDAFLEFYADDLEPAPG